MPTYRVKFKKANSLGDLLVKAALIDIKDPAMVRLRSADDNRVVAAIPTENVCYIKEESES